MAAKKPAAKPATTAVAQRAQVQLPAEVQEQMAADIAAFQQRMSAPTGNRIAVTQDKKFRNAAGDKFAPTHELPVGLLKRLLTPNAPH